MKKCNVCLCFKPDENFSKRTACCKSCDKEKHAINNPINNGIISLAEKYIPQKIRRKSPHRKAIHAVAREVYNGNKTEQELQEFITIIMSGKSPTEANLPRSKPARKRVSTTYDRPLPKEGWVYIMDTYRYNKIGKTWEDGLRARRAEARRWGPADLVYWAWFDDAMAAEKEIHRRLKRYKVEKENVGEELFNCTIDIARDEIKKLKEELEDDARKEQKVG